MCREKVRRKYRLESGLFIRSSVRREFSDALSRVRLISGNYYEHASRYVDWAMGWTLVGVQFDSPAWGELFISYSKRLYLLWGPPRLLF